MLKKLNFLPFFFVSLTWASRAYDEKSTILIIFKRFSLFFTIWMHAQRAWARVVWDSLGVVGPYFNIFWFKHVRTIRNALNIKH